MPNSPSSPTAVLRRWFEGGVWNNPDDESAEAFIDRHYDRSGKAYGLGGSYAEGPDFFKEFRRAFLASCKSALFEVTHCIAEGDQVATRWAAKVVGHDGVERSLDGACFSRMEGDRIVEAWNMVSYAELFDQLAGDPAGTALQRFLETRGAIAPPRDASRCT